MILSDHFKCIHIIGFLERELKNSWYPIMNNGEIPPAPQPKEMIDMEVGNL